GLLAEDVLARTGGRDHVLRVQVRRRRHDDEVHIVARAEGRGIDVGTRSELGGERLGLGGRRGGDRGEPHAGEAGAGAGMRRSGEAGPDDPDAHRHGAHRLARAVGQAVRPISKVAVYPSPDLAGARVSLPPLPWKMPSPSFRSRPEPPFCEYGAWAKIWSFSDSSKKSWDVKSETCPFVAVLRILKWMCTARPWYQPGQIV